MELESKLIKFNWEEIKKSLSDVHKSESSIAIELPHHSKLTGDDTGIYYRYSGACENQHWGRPDTVKLAMNLARNWKKVGGEPLLLLGDISAKNFKETGCHKAHKTGTHIDADLAKTLPRDPGYGPKEQTKCLGLIMIALRLGAKRILFSDSDVAKAANAMAKNEGLIGTVEIRADHDNHFHIELPL